MVKANPIIIIVILTITSFIGCKEEKKGTISNPVEKNKEATITKREIKKEQLFFLKDEIIVPSIDSIYFAKGNEVILFRPSEFDFGLRLEDTQDQTLIELDERFEVLTNEILDTFKGSKNVKISICEKSMIAIPQVADTLYFNTSKDLYGIIFSKSDTKPELKSPTENNIIDQIESTYNWNE